jgi:hypothetical protein
MGGSVPLTEIVFLNRIGIGWLGPVKYATFLSVILLHD